MDDFMDLKIDFNEEDLNDPSLLAELAELIGEAPPIKHQPSSAAAPKIAVKKEEKPAIVEEEIQIEIGPIPDIEEIGEVEVTDEDMNDPHLLAELMKVAGKDENDTEPVKAAGRAESVPSPTLDKIDTILSPTVVDTAVISTDSLESKLKLTNISMLLQYVQIEKVSALNKKRSRDKDGAMQSLRNAKEFQKRIDSLQAVEPQPKVTVPTVPVAPTSVTDSVPIKPELEDRCLSFKKAAVLCKNGGDLEKAKEFLGIAKAIQKAIDTNDASFNIPDPPMITIPASSAVGNITASAPAPSSAPAPTHQISTVTDESGNDLVSHLVSTLEQQISLCTKLSAQYFSSDQKDLALDFHKKKKNMIQDKETLLSMKSIKFDPNAMPFKFHYSTFDYTIAQSNPDIALDQVEISILKGVDISVKGEADPETGVVMDFGWPSSPSAGTLTEGKFETKACKGMSPEYSFRAMVKIERTKAFQRFLERKKASVEVFYQSKSFFGMMSKRDVIGKAVIKLEDLLTKCEIHQFLPIMDPANPRKATGGKLEISIKLRVPLLKTDVVKTSQKWLEVVFGSDPSPQIPISSTTAPTKAVNALPSSQTKPVHTAPTPAAAPLHKTVAKQQPAVAKHPPPTSGDQQEDIDDMEHFFLSPDNIASNAVLEHEHTLLIQRIAAMHPPTEELLDLKSGYEIKMQMLVTSIQMGSLDMPTYISQVKAGIQKTRTLALEFKKHGKLDLAKQAMLRLKLMQSEVDEVEAAQ